MLFCNQIQINIKRMKNPDYPSNISREQFEKIRPILESSRKKTRPRTLDLYDIFNAVLYVVKTGCQWRMIPNDFPKWGTVYANFKIWKTTNEATGKSTLEEVLKKISWRGETKQWSERENKFYNS